MKTSMLIAALLMSGLTFAQNISHMWSKTAGSTNNDAAQAVDVDASGNVYSTGYFYGTVDFDPGPGTSNLTSAGSYDIFIQKLDAYGNLVWVKQIGGASGNDVAFAMDVDATGNIHLTGYFTGTVDFDPGTAVANRNSSGGTDVFVCKLDSNGDYLWAINNTGPSTTNDQGMGIAVDASGNIYYTGLFRTSIDVDPAAPVTLIYSGSGNLQTFLIKLTSTGSYAWGRGFNGTGTSVGNAIALDPTGSDVYFTGYYTGTVDVDPTGALLNRTAVGQNDIFIEKLSSAGSFAWCINYGSNYNEAGQGIAVTSTGVTVSGSFAGTIDFDPGVGTSNMQADVMGNTDAFVLRLTTAGAYTWSKSIGGTGVDVGNAITVDQAGYVYTTGYFSGTADLNPTATTQNATSSGAEDIFVMKLDGSGNFVWSGALGSTGSDMGNAIYSTSSNNMYYAGHFSGNMDFNPGAGNTTITNSGMRDMFCSRWNQCTAAPTTPVSISGPITTCIGATPTYSVTAQNGATYNWTFPAGWSASGNGNSITPTASSTSGIITVVAQNACGTSSAATLTVSVAPTPTTPGAISGQTSPCPNIGYTYSVTPQSGVSYAWSFPAGWSGSSTTNTVAVIAGSNSGNISVAATNACGTSSATTLSVTPLPLPTNPGSISGNDTNCISTTSTYSVAPVAGMTYAWTLPGGWTGSSTTNTITATAGSSGTIQVTASNSCGTSTPSTLPVVVNSAPGTLQNFSVQNPVCENTTQLYSTNALAGTTYTWTLPAGWSGSSTTNSINATAGNTGGTLSVFATNTCGTSNTVSITMSVTATPASPTAISGSDTACANSIEVYNCNLVAGATSYSWTLPAGWSGTSTNNTINVTTANQSGIILVTADNSCGSSAPALITVTADSIPLAPSSISGPNALCENSAFAYSCSPVNNANTYNWTFPSSWTGTGNTQSVSGISGNTGGVITVEAINNCGTSAPSTFNVSINPMPINTISFNNWYLESDQNTANYQWIDCNNNFNPVLGATQQQFVPATNGDYAVIIDLNGCVDTSTCIQFLSSDITENPHSNIRIYPNPASDLININGMGATNDIEIRDISGRTVVKLSNVSGAIDISGLSAGSYLMVIDTENEILTKTFIKE